MTVTVISRFMTVIDFKSKKMDFDVFLLKSKLPIFFLYLRYKKNRTSRGACDDKGNRE